jgi:hypothetical protein
MGGSGSAVAAIAAMLAAAAAMANQSRVFAGTPLSRSVQNGTVVNAAGADSLHCAESSRDRRRRHHR